MDPVRPSEEPRTAGTEIAFRSKPRWNTARRSVLECRHSHPPCGGIEFLDGRPFSPVAFLHIAQSDRSFRELPVAAPKYWTIPALDPHDPSGSSIVEYRLSNSHTEGLRQRNLPARYYRLKLVPFA